MRTACFSPRSDHGPEHWARVESNAEILSRSTTGADSVVAMWFARLHDTMRDNENRDPEHGPRAAAIARDLHAEGLLPLCSAQLETLCFAMDFHDCGGTDVSCPTVAVCWDADRLDLPRVGITPHPAFMSTPAGKWIAQMLQDEAAASAPVWEDDESDPDDWFEEA